MRGRENGREMGEKKCEPERNREVSYVALLFSNSSPVVALLVVQSVKLC